MKDAHYCFHLDIDFQIASIRKRDIFCKVKEDEGNFTKTPGTLEVMVTSLRARRTP
jgi:hypothetical protein